MAGVTPRQRDGARAEDIALARLQTAGLCLEARNFRCRQGEIDLVLRHARELVFVEVRYRRRQDYGGGAASVDRRKQARIVACARHYLLTRWRGPEPPVRFDVVALAPDAAAPDGLAWDWIRQAFDAD